MTRNCSEALRLMEAALGILDEHGAPADIGAHLDLAICRLRAAIGSHDAVVSTNEQRHTLNMRQSVN